MLVAYGFDELAVERTADQLLDEIERREAEFKGRLYAVEEAVREAIRLSAGAAGPVILADSQDNPGGGGAGDTTGILRELVVQGAQQALVGVLNDAAAAQKAHQAGDRRRLSLSVSAASQGCREILPSRPNSACSRSALAGFAPAGRCSPGPRSISGRPRCCRWAVYRMAVGSRAIQTMDQVDVSPPRCRTLRAAHHRDQEQRALPQ